MSQMINIKIINFFIFKFIFLFAYFSTSYAQINPELENSTSRFISSEDIKTEIVAGFKLPCTWWSRPYEYAWAANFVGNDLVVLDAACGISHPFKWLLGQTCKEVWACDTDERIQELKKIILEIKDDLGEESFKKVISNPQIYLPIHFVHASICHLPNNMPKFDRIFCISTLEHLSEEDRKSALKEFSRSLKPDGLIILTVDYPVITPDALFKTASEVGLVPASEVNYFPRINSITCLPTKNITNIQLYVYRCVLKHQ